MQLCLWNLFSASRKQIKLLEETGHNDCLKGNMPSINELSLYQKHFTHDDKLKFKIDQSAGRLSNF